jgi:hypothetical protein
MIQHQREMSHNHRNIPRPTTQSIADHFYAIFRPLLFYVNTRLQIVPGLRDAAETARWPVAEVNQIRKAVWAYGSRRNPCATPDCQTSRPTWMGAPTTAFTGFKRFCKFMTETGRMDWGEADNILRWQ